MADFPRMSPEEFRDSGLLLEVNRRFFHPLGLAMAVDLPDEDEEGEPGIIILDDRQDPEGWRFGDIEADEYQTKILNVRLIEQDRYDARMEALGYWVQPTGEG